MLSPLMVSRVKHMIWYCILWLLIYSIMCFGEIYVPLSSSTHLQNQEAEALWDSVIHGALRGRAERSLQAVGGTQLLRHRADTRSWDGSRLCLTWLPLFPKAQSLFYTREDRTHMLPIYLLLCALSFGLLYKGKAEPLWKENRGEASISSTVRNEVKRKQKVWQGAV